MDLIDRKYRILQAIIDDYIMTALPVGSRTISRKYEQKLSSATIRNEMSDLEELGYLDSPHTSAGRIPSYKAYRLYVDRMIHPMPLSEEETAFIKGCFDRRINQVEELSARIAKALSSMTHYTTAVMTRAPREEQVFSHLQLVPVSDRGLLLVIVTRSGAVRQTVIDTEKPIAPDALYTVSQIISRELEGCAMDQLPARLTRLAGGQPLDATGSRIYILGNIDNAFALLDETFCCTPLLLDPETARQYRIDFMQVYIHENLHRLSLSGELLDMLQTLYDNDDFYRTHEDRARAYGEGGNEAFVVAAERYVSRRLGRIDDKQVLDEFLVYCDGTHVLAPIVYRYLPDLRDGESFDGFLRRLFDRRIRPGKVESQYRRAMKKLAGTRKSEPTAAETRSRTQNP